MITTTAPRYLDPRVVEHPELREFALQAAWVARLEESVEALEDLAQDLRTGERDADPNAVLEPWEEDPLDAALLIVTNAHEEADRDLETGLIEWLARDPEHWPIFRLVVFDAWQESPGRWREDVPRWVQSLGTNTILAHFQQDPYGRQRGVEPDVE
jgi:hypothetical protein